jgi:glutamine amidotransferase
MTYLGEDWGAQHDVQHMKAALFKTINTIIKLQTELNPTPEGGIVPSSLNLCVTDGEQLVAVRFRNVKGDNFQPPVSTHI